jgi:hypothetical protein
MVAVSSTSDLVAVLKKSLTDQVAAVIGIDGIDGSGKTTLAQELGEALGLPIVSIDSFLDKKKGSYLDHLRYSDLSKASSDFTGAFILEGICLLYVAEHIEVNITDLVYIKPVDDWGFWSEAEIYDTEEPVEELIEKLGQDADKIAPLLNGIIPSVGGEDIDSRGLHPFREEVIRYHAKYRPARKADYVYLRRRGRSVD